MNQLSKPARYGGIIVLLAWLLSRGGVDAASATVSVAHDFDAEWTYAGSATTRGGNVRFDSGAEQNSSLRYLFSPQITSRVLLHFGAEWQRFAFDLPEHAPLPDTLDEISARIGLDWQCTDQWLVRAEVRPGIYSDLEDVSWKDVDAPVVLSGTYLMSPDVQWVFGVRVDPLSNYPVIPAVGLRWKFADQWTLNGVLPQPRLEYDLSQSFQAYLGADVKARAFRMGDDFNERPGWTGLNGSVLDYFEVRVGPGCSWKVRPAIIIEANAGCLVYRRFDFRDQDVHFASDPAPYFQIACGLRF